MTITGAIVLYAVVWFLTFFVVLQWRVTSQADAGRVEPGTPPGAPAQEVVRRKAIVTTMIATVLWAGIAAVILCGGISVRDFDWAGRMRPLPEADGTGG